MTLLELLVKELPGRGGWPSLADNCQTYINGKRYAFFFDKTGFTVPVGFTVSMEDVDTDNSSTGVTREQYEYAIAAQQPAWNGEGLPTTGVKCEWQDYNTKKWTPVRVVYSSEWVTIISEDKDDDAIEAAIENYGDKGRRKFRPLRSEAESKREEVIDCIANLIHRSDPGDDATSVYEAIAAGKIPGVEISK